MPIVYYHILDTKGEAITVSADLHYVASTGKNPAETQDANTSTHPGKCYLCGLQQPTISDVASC